MARSLVLTEPQVYAKAPREAEEAADMVRGRVSARVLAIPDPEDALDAALDLAGPDDLVLITGSLYLCGQLRGRFYPAERVLAERCSWF